MNKITVIVPFKKADAFDKILKSHQITKVVKLRASSLCKYELLVTDLQTPDVLSFIREGLSLTNNSPFCDGYVSVNETNLVVPSIMEKGKFVEIDELILKGAKQFIKLDRNFILFIICSSIIACLGFQIDSLVTLIGAMVISPLMAPLMAASYGMSRSNNTLAYKGLKTELAGIGLIIIVSFLMSVIPNASFNLERSMAGTNLFYSLILSIVIGVVGAHSFITGHAETLIGVAVGISLLPPLTNSILLLVGSDFIHSINALFNFIFNVLGMHLSALIYFLVIKKVVNKNNKLVIKSH